MTTENEQRGSAVITNPGQGASVRNALIPVEGTVPVTNLSLVLRLYTVGGATPVAEETVKLTGFNWAAEIRGTFSPGGYRIVASQTGDTAINVTLRVTPVSITSPANNAQLPNQQFTVTGNGGEHNVGTVSLYNASNNALLTNAVIQPNGSWTAQLTMIDNSLGFYARQMIGTFPSSNTATVNVSYKVATVVIKSPENGAEVTTFKPTVSGEGETRATITVHRAGNTADVYGTGSVVGGKWNIPLTKALPLGLITLQANQNAGGVTTSSNQVSITVAVRLQKPVISPPSPPNAAQDTEFDVIGTGGVAGSTMHIAYDLNNPIEVGQAPVTSGNWTVRVKVDPGRRSLVAQQKAPGILPSYFSNAQPFDIRPPAMTKVDVTQLSTTSIMFSGTGLNEASVEISKTSGPDVTMPAVVSVVNGKWETRATGWPLGTYQLKAIQKVGNGANGWIESLPFAFTVTNAVPVPYDASSNTDYQPTLTGKGVRTTGVVSFFNADETTKIAADAQVNAADVWSRRVNGSWGPTWQRPVHIRQTMNGQSSAFIVLNVNIPPLAPVIEGVEKESLSPLVSGKCWSNAGVQVEFDNDGRKLDATVSGESWTYQRAQPFEAGTTHTVKATQTAAQQTSPPATATFTVERPMVVPDVIFPGEAEKVGRNLIIRGLGGMKDAIVSLYDARFGNELGRSAAPLIADGEWVIELETLSFRLYTVEVMQKIGERESARSAWFTFSVVLQTFITDPLPGRIRTRNAEFEGRGLEGGLVALYLGDASEPFAENIRVGADGYWRATARLDVGHATVRAEQSFESEVSDTSVAFRVVPAAPTIETPAAGEHVEGRTVVSGFGVAGDIVTVMLGDAENTILEETTVEGDGSWSVPVNIPHPGGDVDLVAASSVSDFVSDASPTRRVKLGTYMPGFTHPSAHASVSNPVHFAGTGRAGEGTLYKWFNPEELLARNIPVDEAGWSVEASGELQHGGNWAEYHQSLTDDPGGATLSARAQSPRFEVGPADARTALKTSDKR